MMELPKEPIDYAKELELYTKSLHRIRAAITAINDSCFNTGRLSDSYSLQRAKEELSSLESEAFNLIGTFYFASLEEKK